MEGVMGEWVEEEVVEGGMRMGMELVVGALACRWVSGEGEKCRRGRGLVVALAVEGMEGGEGGIEMTNHPLSQRWT